MMAPLACSSIVGKQSRHLGPYPGARAGHDHDATFNPYYPPPFYPDARDQDCESPVYT